MRRQFPKGLRYHGGLHHPGELVEAMKLRGIAVFHSALYIDVIGEITRLL